VNTKIDKHTDSPWAIHWGTAQGGDGHWIVDSQDNCELSRVAMVAFHDDKSGGETRANARLIAASPDLLAALVACRDQLAGWVDSGSLDDSDFYAIKMADAAIRKAAGGTSKREG
jgi:hypothetical protein